MYSVCGSSDAEQDFEINVPDVPDLNYQKTPPVSKQYPQFYRPAWESLPDFKGWLSPVKGEPRRAYCSTCDKTLSAHRLSLLKHTCSMKHMKLAQLKLKESQRVEEEQGVRDEEDVDDVAVMVVNVNHEQKANCTAQQTPESETDKAECQPVSTLGNSCQVTVKKKIATAPAPRPQPPITTHVLDLVKGLPVSGLKVSLYQLIDGKWTHLTDDFTNPDGRCTAFVAREELKPGRFKLHFDVDRYFSLRSQESIYPFIEVVFDVCSPLGHYHIPLLLSPYGYTTYRGS